MKLHLPTLLRGALIACMGMACTAYATDYNAAHVTSGTRPDAYSGYEGSGIYAVVAGANTKLNEVAEGDKIIFNLSGGYMVKASKTGDNAIKADVEIQDLKLNDGFSNQTYEFTGTVTGSGTLWFNKQSPYDQNYTFTGDVSGFDGVIDFNKQGADKDHTFTFTNNDATTAKALNASSVSVGGEIIFNGTGNYTSNSVLTAYEVQANTNVTFSKNVTALTTFTVASGKTATFTAGLLDLTGATLSNSGTLDFSTGTATLRLAADGNLGTSYTVGTLTLGDRQLSEVLVGLVGRQSASYANGVISITSSGQLVWKAAADGETWTAATWDMGGTDTTFQTRDNVTFGAGAGSKKVGITGSVSAGTITIEDNYEFNVTSNATVTGTFSMADGTTLTKTGSATLMLDAAATSSFETLQVNEGTVNIGNSNFTIDTLDIQGGMVDITSGVHTNIAQVNIHNGGTLHLNGNGTRLTSANVTLYGGGKLYLDNGSWDSAGPGFGADGKTITIVDADTTNAVLGGSYYGTGKVASTIQGSGTLELTTDSGTNAVQLLGEIKDKDGSLALKQTNGTYKLFHANTYTGGTTLTSGTMEVHNAQGLGNGDVTVSGGTLYVASGITSVDLGAADKTITIENGGTLQTNHALSLTGALTMNDGATLNLSGFDFSAQTFSGETTVMTTTGDITVGNITVQGLPSGEGLVALKAADNALTVVTSPDLVLTKVTPTYANDTLTFQLSTDVTHLFGDVVISLGDMTAPELGDLVLAAKGDFEGEVSLSFTNAAGELIYLTGVTSLSINGYSGEEGWAVSTDGLSVGSYKTAMIPEPTTATLSLLALAGLAARRRRK